MSAGIPIPPGIAASRESGSASRDARKPPTHRFGDVVAEAWDSPEKFRSSACTRFLRVGRLPT